MRSDLLWIEASLQSMTTKAEVFVGWIGCTVVITRHSHRKGIQFQRLLPTHEHNHCVWQVCPHIGSFSKSWLFCLRRLLTLLGLFCFRFIPLTRSPVDNANTAHTLCVWPFNCCTQWAPFHTRIVLDRKVRTQMVVQELIPRSRN